MIQLIDHPTCPQVLQDQCNTCYQRKHHAMRRMLALATDVRKLEDPVGWVDARTSMNDARIALNVARGVPLHLIDPCMGYAPAIR